MDGEGNRERSRWPHGVRMDEDSTASNLCAPVEGRDPRPDVERQLVGYEEPGEETAPSDKRPAAAFDGGADVGTNEPGSGTDRKPPGVEHSAPGEFEADPVDPGQWCSAGGHHAAGKPNGDRGRTVPR